MSMILIIMLNKCIIVIKIIVIKKQAAYLLIAVGSLIFVIAFLGYCGALQVYRMTMYEDDNNDLYDDGGSNADNNDDI